MATSALNPAQPAPSERVDYRRLLWVAPLAAILAAVANAILYFIADALGAFPASVLVPGANQPLTVGPIIFSSLGGTLAGAVVFAIIGRFARRPVSTFRVVAAIVLVLSFAQPFLIPDADFGYRAWLIAMHIVAGVIAIVLLTTLARKA